MSFFDLLDIYEILIQIRFSIDTDESQQLISLLFDALHLKLGKLLHNQNVDDKFIREYILENCEFEYLKLGSFDDNYSNGNIMPNETNVLFSFFIVVSAVKKKISTGEYSEAFFLVDKFHNYPVNILMSKKNAKKMIVKDAGFLLKTGMV